MSYPSMMPMQVIRDEDGNVLRTQIGGGAIETPEDARWRELRSRYVRGVRGDGLQLTDQESAEYRTLSDKLSQRPDSALSMSREAQNNRWRQMAADRAAAEEAEKSGPYGKVTWQEDGRLRSAPRYKVDAQRAMSEMAVEKARFEMEQAREQAQQQADMQRWMFEQMRRNPYGANIRDLIYGAGGK